MKTRAGFSDDFHFPPVSRSDSEGSGPDGPTSLPTADTRPLRGDGVTVGTLVAWHSEAAHVRRGHVHVLWVEQ